MVNPTLNLRVLLWQKTKLHDGDNRLEVWSKLLQSNTAIPLPRAQELILGEPPSTHEIGLICSELGVLEESFVQGDLLRDFKINILQENLRFLLDGLEHGQQKTLGVDRSTIGRWLKEQVTPRQRSLDELCSELGLSPKVDLKRDPIFLQVEPIHAAEARQWLKSQIDTVDSQYLLEIYPALRRLLETR